MRFAVFPAVLLSVASFSVGSAASAGESGRAGFEEYLGRLRELVREHGRRTARMAVWCGENGLGNEAEQAFLHASECDPEIRAPSQTAAAGPPATPAEYETRLSAVRCAASRSYVTLAKWLLDRGSKFEARRCVEKALLWNPEESEARRLALGSELKGRFLLGNPSAGALVWSGNRWITLSEFERTSRSRVERLLKKARKSSGLDLSAKWIPGLDLIYTQDEESASRAAADAGMFMDFARGRFFLADPATPRLLYLVREEKECRALGKEGVAFGSYEWGKGTLYIYPSPLGRGVVLHELTHAMTEANCRGFPPLWFLEGLACFFEDWAGTEEGAAFGVTNWRDEVYASMLKAGKARPLENLLKDCVMSIDPAGYAQARSLMMYLWSIGQLEAFVMSVQFQDDAGKSADVLRALLMDDFASAGKHLEEFARSHFRKGELIPRGLRPDEKIDSVMIPFPEGPVPGVR